MPVLALASSDRDAAAATAATAATAAKTKRSWPRQSHGPPGAPTLAHQLTTDIIFAAVNDDDDDPVPLLKQQLAHAIVEFLGPSGEGNMASRLGVDQPRASNLQHGRLERFSLQQLVRFVARADGEVTLTVRWRSRRVWIIPRPPRRPPRRGPRVP